MKKVLVITGNTMEIGQTLTNLFGQNPDFKIHYQFVGSGIRAIEQRGIISPGQQQYEPITTLYLVYSNKGDIKGLNLQGVDTTVKAKITN